MYSKKNDCDVLLNNSKDLFHSLNYSFETVLDKKKSKMNVLGSIFSLGKNLTKLTFNTGVCIAKNTPKAIVVVASVKRDIVTVFQEEIYEQQKQAKEEALNEKIKQLILRAK